MKLRDLVANSLPRVRGRKKKGQPSVSNTTAASISAAVVVATTTSIQPPAQQQRQGKCETTFSPRAVQRQDGNGNWFQFGAESRFAFLEKLVGKESPVKRLFETKADTRRRQTSPAVGGSDREEEKRGERRVVSAEGRQWRGSVSDCPSPYGSADIASPSVLVDKPVFYSHHASPVYGSYRDPVYSERDCSGLHRAGYAESVTSYDSTPGSQRGLRSRSRIRTNPWLPSPRPSPYSVRSFSSPCASSRSPSPCSSPAPPSSSDSTSPLTSFSSDISGARESQLHRHHRRHRRHHSEIKASDLTRRVATDAPLTDTEQYYSTLDSGIGETATSPEEKDKLRITATKKQRYSSSKRRSAERDSQSLKNLSNFPSSSPKAKAKLRPRTRGSNSSSKRLVANRDSKFWDSDSSRSPPRSSRSTDSKSAKYPCTASEDVSPPSHRGKHLCHSWKGDDPYAHSSVFFTEGLNAGFGSDSEEDDSSVLSPCEDICVITSNIEQLAQNISSEYEDSLDVSVDSSHQTPASKPGCLSLRALYNIDADSGPGLPLRPGAHLHLDLDYATFSQPLACGQSVGRDRTSLQEPQLDTTLTDNHHSATDQGMPMVDAAVQTDFVDVDEDEENSGSDWLVNTESGSGCDWLVGEGSGCATDEEGGEDEEEEERAVTEGEEEDASFCEEGGKFWIIPDIMQNSTDTGYSSLSRDGRIVADCDNNNNNNSHVNDNGNGNSLSEAGNNAEGCVDVNKSGSAQPEKATGSASAKDTPSQGRAETTPGRSPSEQRRVVVDEPHCLSPLLECEQIQELQMDHFENKTVLGPYTFETSESEYCSCVGKNLSNERDALEDSDHIDTFGRDADRESAVPYPYDVTRFSDVMLSCVSPRCDVSVSSQSDRTAWRERGPGEARAAPRSSTPRQGSSHPLSEHVFCSCHDPATDSAATSHHRSVSLSADRHRHRQDSPLPLSEFAQDPNPTSPTGRSLREVRASLEDKIQFLKQGKRVVGRKIREAREEEMVRQQQKLRFQKLLDIHRKRILLQTLQDLRKRLESQSSRLQDSYSAVLDLQKRYV